MFGAKAASSSTCWHARVGMDVTGTFTDYEPLGRRRFDGETNLSHSAVASATAPYFHPRPSTANATPDRQLVASPGHAISFFGLVVFTLILYFRPQQSYPSLASVPFALIAALFTLGIFIPSQIMREGSLTIRTREVHLLLLLAAAALLSVPFGINPANSLHTFWEPFLKTAIIFVVLINVVRTPRRLHLMLYLAFAVTWVIAVAALSDYRLGNLTVEGYRLRGAIAGGMFENANDLGVHLVTVAPLALALGFAMRNVIVKVFCWITAGLAIAAMVLTYSRGAFLGLLAVTLVLSWKLVRGRRPSLMFLLLAACLLFVFLVPGYYWIRLLSIFDPTLDAFGSGAARSELLAHSFLVALRHPLLGIGMGNYSLVSSHSLVSHNSYTQVGSEMGMGALFAYTMFVTAPLHGLLKIERETLKRPELTHFYYLAVGLQASLIGYMVSSFFVSVAYYWFAYYLVGYAICFRRLYRSIEPRKVLTVE